MCISPPYWHPSAAKAYIFDWDGVLSETRLDFSSLRNQYFNGRKAMILEEAFSLPKSTHDELMSDLYNLEMQGAHTAQPIPGVCELIEYIDNNKIPWAIVSRNCKDSIVLAADRIGLKLPDFVGNRNDSIVKPDPRALWEAANSLNTCPKDCVFFGDFLYDLMGARRASMRSILVHRKEKNWEKWYDAYYPTFTSFMNELSQCIPVIPWEYQKTVQDFGEDWLKKAYTLHVRIPQSTNCSPEWISCAASLGIGYFLVEKGRTLNPELFQSIPSWNPKYLGEPLVHMIQKFLDARFPLATVVESSLTHDAVQLPNNPKQISAALKEIIS